MWQVVLALIPAGAWGVYRFGAAALWVVALSVAAAVVTEALIQYLAKKPITIRDGSAVVTGLLLAYVLPSHGVREGQLTLLPWYVPVVGAFVAIAIAKHCFGGLGQNVWNPALVGRAFVQVSFPTLVTLSQWPAPWREGDALTQATALAKETTTDYRILDLFLGRCPGCIGEVSALLLLVGGIYLMLRKYVDWRMVTAYLGAVVLLTALVPAKPDTAWAEDPAYAQKRIAAEADKTADDEQAPEAEEKTDETYPWLANRDRFELILYHLFAGGLMLGALYMASDMVTSPLVPKGQIIFGLGCGALTVLIRFRAGLPEGVCYAILLMNTARPLIDRHTRPRILGERRS